MRNSFWDLFWGSLLKLNTAIAIIVAILLWIVSPNEKITLRWALPIGAIFVFFIFIFASVAYKSSKMSKSVLPKVLYAKKLDTKNQQSEKVICLLEPSELFSYNALISFYYVGDESFEQLLGIGTVRNIQEDGKIQVVMIHSLEEHVEKVKKLAQNNAELLKRIKVKPYIPGDYLDPRIF